MTDKNQYQTDQYSSSNDSVSTLNAEYWQSVYDGCNYEGAAYYDPRFEWSTEEEKKLIRKLDRKVFMWAFVLFSALDLVRRNINRAVSDNFLDDLNINTNDYNLGQALFLVAFLSFELPGNLLTKKFGAEIVIPIEVCAWLILCIFQTLLKNRGGFLALRVLLGISQGGFIPDTILYLSYFYTSYELPLRLAFFWTAIPLLQILGSLLASGLLELRGTHGLTGWQYLFLIEGLMSLAIGVASWYFMRTGPTQSANKLFKTKPWFDEREVKILVNRILRDDPLKGDMNNRQAVSLKQIFLTLTEYDLWPIFIQGITAFIPFQPVTNYISLILREMGYSTFMSNILAIPGQAWFLFNLPLIVYISRKLNEKSLCVGFSNLYIFPFILALVVLPNDTNQWVKYVLLTGILSQPYVHAILASWVSQISNSVRARAVATSFYNMSYQIGSIISTQLFTESDKPYYNKGNKIILGICVFNMVFSVFTKFYYIYRNRAKQAKWQAMTKEQQDDYRRNTKDTGLKRLDFIIAN